MANPNSFLQSPFQTLIAQQEEAKPLPGSDPVKDAALPDLSAEPAPAPAATPAPRATASPVSLLPPTNLRPLFEATAAHFKVPVNVLMAITQQESGYNPDATNKDTGAAGMAQYIGATAKSLGINPRDPNEAVPAAAMQLRERLDKGYSVEDAIKEHFAGPDRKLWKGKTAAYGQEVLAKAGAIGKELYGDAADEEPAAQAQPPAAPNQATAKQPDAEFGPLSLFAPLNKTPQQKVKEAYSTPATDEINPSVDARARRLVRQGMRGDIANAVAAQAVKNGMLPGQEPGAGQTASVSNFDFDTQKKFNSDPVYSNPVMRAAVKGYEGYKHGVLGINQFVGELVGADVSGQKRLADESRGKVEAIGDPHSYGQQMFEGAVSSIAQQLPALIGGMATGLEAVPLAAMFMQSFGQEYSDGRAKGQDQNQATARAALYGTFEVVGEKFGLGDKLKGLRGALHGADAKDVATSMAKALLKEIPGEELTTLGQFGTDKLGGGVGMNTEAGLADYLKQAADTAVQTIVQGGVMGGAATGVAHIHSKINTPERQIARAIQQNVDGAEFTQPAGQVALQQMDPNGAVAIDPRDTVRPPAPAVPEAPAAPAGPLSAAVEAAAPRPAFQADGDGFTGQILGDDGQVHTIDSRTGVVMADEPAAPSGPLEAAIQEAAAQHAVNPAPLPELPSAAPQPPALDTLPLEDLRAQLKEVAAVAKTNPEQRQQLTKQRAAIEKEIGARAKQAKADSKPAEEPLSTGPFEDIKAANKMMLRYAEQTGQPHEVVGSEGKFTVRAIGGQGDGINPAGAARGPDGHGRSGEPLDAVGGADGTGSGAAGRGAGGSERAAGSRAVASELPDAGPDRAAADGAADPQPALKGKRDAVSKAGKDGAHGAAGMPDAQPGAAVAAGKQGADVAVPAVDAKAAAPALTEEPYWKTNPFHAYAFPDQARADAFMDKKSVDRAQFEAVQTGPVRWQVKQRSAPVQESFAKEVTADVPESPQVPEEAPPAPSTQAAQPVDTIAAAGSEAGAVAAPAKPKRKPSQRELTNAKQEEVVKAAAEKLTARKAEKVATQEARLATELATKPDALLFRGIQYRKGSSGWEMSRDGERWGEVRQRSAREALDRGEDPNPTDARIARPAASKAEVQAGQDEAVRYSIEGDQTDSPAFKRWFDGSAVVDEDGKPMVMYHGTSSHGFNTFDTYASNYGLMGMGGYFTADPYVAKSYTTKGKGGKPGVYNVFLSIKNPLDMDAKADPAKWQKQFNGIEQYHDGGDTNESWYRAAEDMLGDEGLPKWEGAEAMQEGIRTMGHDGITHIGGGRVQADGVRHRVYIAFEPEQIKSAGRNNGDFDPANPDIRYSTGHPLADDAPRAVSPLVQSLADKGVIVLHADASTLPVKGRAPAGVQALTTADGTIHVVANALGDHATGIILHEAFHAGVKPLIGSAAWDGLQTRLGALYHQGEQSSGAARVFWDAARARVATAKAKGAVASGMEVEEFGAYAIEEYAKAPASIRKWVDDLLGAVKAWALRRFGKQLGDVTPAQLTALAKLALLDAQAARSARPDLAPAFSSDSSKTIEVDGQRRPIENSRGQLIAPDMHKQMAFWRWAKDTKAADEQGRPLVVYHGSFADFSEFDSAKSEDGAFHFGTSEAAIERLRGKRGTLRGAEPDGQNVMPMYLRIANPKHLNSDPMDAKSWRRVIAKAKAQGHDGIAYPNEQEGGESWVAFSPDQIKSATGNDGSFSGDTPDIRYSVAGSPQPRTLTPDEQGLLRRVQGAVQDNMNRVRQVQDRISELTGVKDLAGADYYGAETNRPGRIAARKEDGRDKLIEPMMRRLAKAGYTPDQLSELLHAQHAEERNKAVAQINPEFPDGGSGMKTADANAIIARYANEPALLALADEARQIARETLEMKLAYGLITQAQYDSLSISYDNYVPLKGDGEYGPKVKRAMGHEDREEHIIENIARDFEQAIVVGEKNLARQSLLQMVLQYSDDSLWTARVPPKGRYVAGTVFEISPVGTRNVEASFTSQSQVAAWLEGKGQAAAGYEVNTSGGEHVTEFTKPLQDNEVMVYVKGSPVRIQIFDEVLARQLRPLHTEMMNTVLGLMQKHNRYLSTIYTGYNPAFILKNATRDAITGSINMTGNHGAVTAAKAWAKYPAAWATMLKWAMTKEIPAGPMGDALREYRAMGGKVGASYMSDLEEQGKTLQRMFDDQRGFLKTAMDVQPGESRTWRAGFTKSNERRATAVAAGKTIGKLAHVIEVLNQAFENALRLALFAQLRAEGKKPGQAAQAAKTVTVNFDRKGTATPYLGAFYLFINPAIQGTANLTNTLTRGEHKGQAWALAGMMAAAGFAAALHGMDDDKDRWLGEKWDTRTKNLRIRVGSYTVNVPLSQEYAPFYAVGVAMGEVRRGESSLRASAHVLSSFLDAYYPMQGAIQPGSDNYGMDLLLAHVPTVGKMLAQVAANRNSFGNKVVPESDNTKNRPDNLKMYRGTKNSAYDASAQGIAAAGQALGADKYGNDLSKVSPETLKLAWSTYTGGLGKFVADSAGLGAMLAQGADQVEVGDMPVVKDFVKADKMLPLRTRYFDLADQAQEAIDQFHMADKMKDATEKKRIFDNPKLRPALFMAKMITATNKAEGAFADDAVNINADKKMPAAEKRAQLKELEKKQQDMYQRAINVFSGKNPDGSAKEVVTAFKK